MAEITIYGPIGEDMFGGFTSAELKKQLEVIPKNEPLTVRLSSPGGSVREGATIYTMLAERQPTVVIDGAAWSIASLIAMAGKTIRMSQAASIMIHDAWGMTVGNAEDHLRNAEALDKLSETIASVIARRTGKQQNEIRDMMKAETWFTADEAEDFGLVDEVYDPGETQAAASLKTQYAWGSVYSKGFADFAKARLVWNINKERKEEETMSENATKTVEPTAGQSPPAPATAQAAAEKPREVPVVDIRDQLKELFAQALREAVTAVKQEPVATALDRRPSISVRTETLDDLLRDKSPKDRVEFLKREWNHLRQAFPLFDPMAANTDATSPAGALTPALVSSVVITVLQNRLAPLEAFARNVMAGRIGRNAVQVPVYSGNGTSQENPTNFEDAAAAAATITNYAVTPVHIVTYMHMTNAELQNGWQLAWLAEGKASEFADKVMNKITSLLNVTNFPSPYLKPYANFTANDMKALWAAINKADRKYAILHPEYYKILLPDNLMSFNPLDTGNIPGWDGVFAQTYWTGAGTDILGVVLNPQAIVVAAGLPLEPPAAPNRPVGSTATVEKIGMQVDMYTWFSPATRTVWQTIECMFGAAKGDATAAKLLKNNTT
jgi:ATP-dependent Clp endopeptidase proteolytic subunit ClpP